MDHLSSVDRKILVCLDGSAASEVCIPYALGLARIFGGGVTLLRVLSPPRSEHDVRAIDALGWELERQAALSHLERIQDSLSAEIPSGDLDVRLEQGRPSARIIATAAEVNADLAVLANHGAGGAPEGVLGSTVQQLLALGRLSVLVAPATQGKQHLRPKRVVVPLDGSTRAESVLPAAARLARAHQARLVLVHVVREPPTTAMLELSSGVELARQLAVNLHAGAERYLNRLQQQLANEGTPTEVVAIRHPNDRQGLLEVAEGDGASLVVLSAHGTTCDTSESFGSTTSYLLSHAQLPVLMLQDLRASERRGLHGQSSLGPPSLRGSQASLPA